MMVMIFLFFQRERRRPRRVSRVETRNNKREVRKKGIWEKLNALLVTKMGHYVGQCPNRKMKK
jgi:hypothetical protein